MAYDGIALNEERAKIPFTESGRTSDAALRKAVPVVAARELQHRLEGPADTGCAGTMHEQCATIDGEDAEEEEEEVDINAALPDEEFSLVALPAMHVCASNLTSGDMDEIQAIGKVHAELQKLQKVALADMEGSGPARAVQGRAKSLQIAARALLPEKFVDKVDQAADEVDAAESSKQPALPFEAYAVHTASKPLSMYSAPTWAMCFPHCFLYGDGVFGLPREQPLTFQRRAGMHLLREELSYDIAPAMMDAAATWFGSATQKPCDDLHVSSESAPGLCQCCQCSAACQPFRPPRQPR